MRQNKSQTRQNVLNKLYNQDIAPEDSQITSFYYHKTLALECLIAVFSLCSVVLTLILYIFKHNLSTQILKRICNLLIILTLVGVFGIILKKISEMKWIKQKKQKNINLKRQILFLIIQVILYLPTPMTQTDHTFEIVTYEFQTKQMNYNSFISIYLLFNRFVYMIVFLIHSQLFYGSRPDRLSRLYTVKFGTFNAVKFLINQKPWEVVKTTFSFNFIVLPFALLLIEGEVNKYLNNFHSCLYFVVVAQVTVGYGDIYISTIFGRALTVFIIMAGITNTALLLILFMRLMELEGQQQQSLFLLESLQKKVNLMKSRVFRIQSEWVYSTTRCTPEERLKKEEELKAIRYNNRRNIMLDRAGPINIKRMMLSNFSQIVQNLNVIRQKNNIIAKCVNVIKSSDVGGEKKVENQMSRFGRYKNQNEQASPMGKPRQKFRAQPQRKKQNTLIKNIMQNKNDLKQSFSQLLNPDSKPENKENVVKKEHQNHQKKKQKISGFLFGVENDEHEQ